MDYALALADAPDAVPGGTGILLVHPSTAETDRIDSDFLRVDTDHYLVISTRTTARGVEQKLEHYDLDPEKAVVLDTLSVERGYSRRSGERVHYVSAPDDLDGIVATARQFLAGHDGKLRVSLDSVTELAYYAGDEPTFEAVGELLELLDRYDAVGLFHLSAEVHDEETLARYRELFDGVLELGEDGSVSASF